MLRTTGLGALVLLCTLVGPVPAAEGETTVNWPSYRGPHASGIALGAPPIRWDLESSLNVRWKTEIPGLGHSSPVIWGDRLFVTTAISGKTDPMLKVGLYGDIESVDDDTVHRWRIYCLDKSTGKILWTRLAHEGVPKVKRHPKASHANPTPATDGKHVVAFFGSEGLYAYDMDGNLLWVKDLGVLDSAFFRVPTAQWGFGSSPVIHRDRVIVQCDVLEDSFLAAFDVKTGKEIWRKSRREVPTWSTPTIHEHGGRTQILVNGYRHIGAYDFENGKEIWVMAGGGDIPVPTPVVAGDRVFITNAHGILAPIYAISLDAQGVLNAEEDVGPGEPIAWWQPRGGAYMQTPLVHDDLLYVCRDNGALSIYDIGSGRRRYQKRIGNGSSGFTASAVAAADRIYYTSEMGDVFVIRAGPEYQLLARNALDEITMATPAISEDTLYFRTRGHVVAIGEPAGTGTGESAAAPVGTDQ
jgi:outer membrane protein assembly factor BamB